MNNTEQLSYAVIPDTHGQRETVARVVESLEPDVDKFLLLGDVLDGPDTRGLIGVIRDLGDKALTITGNHEWACRRALAVDEDPVTDIWRTEVWAGYENRMLESYGLHQSNDWQDNAKQLREVMAESGDLAWLESLPPYVETDKFIAIHSGPDPTVSWPEQATYLDFAASPKGNQEEPEQIFSHTLAKNADIPVWVDERTFVSGHFHSDLPRDERVTARRIRLGTKLAAGAPLFVWHSTEDTIHSF